MPEDDRTRWPVGRGRFATTRWSVVLQAGEREGAASEEALAALCEVYWYPLYSFVRRWGHSADDAQDLTQEFFARLLEKGALRAATPSRGRFRSFLLAALKHFLSNERERTNALKRGGGRPPLPLEFETAEGRYSLEPAGQGDPEQAFERQWALAVLAETLRRLEAEQANAGKLDVFARLKGELTGDRELSYADLGKQLGMSEGAVKVAVHRLRRRFGELLRKEIAGTVSDPQEVDDEIRYLFAALG